MLMCVVCPRMHVMQEALRSVSTALAAAPGGELELAPEGPAVAALIEALCAQHGAK